MIKMFCFCLFATMLFSCADEPKQMTENTKMDGANVTTVKDAPTTDTVIELQVEPFEMPPQVRGCSGVFASDSAGLLKGQYFFVSDLQGTAYVKVNGQLMQFRIAPETNSKQKLSGTYNSNGVLVTFTSRQIKSVGDELWEHAGELHIKRGSQEITMPLTGLVGC